MQLIMTIGLMKQSLDEFKRLFKGHSTVTDHLMSPRNHLK